MKTWTTKILGKTVKMEKVCEKVTYPDVNGLPDLDNPHKCTNWATRKIYWKGNTNWTYYCDKHYPQR